MINYIRSMYRMMALLLIVIITLSTAIAPTMHAQAVPTTVELIAIADARIQAGNPDTGFGSGFIWTGTANGHLAYVQFDLLALPANATLTSAELRLSFQGTYTGTANVEVGRTDSAWDEATITWNTRPASTFNGNIQPVGDTPGDVTWPVTGIVTQWYNNTRPNYGFALKGDGVLKAFHSRETSSTVPPRLIVTYTLPTETGPRPDLGDAPDSSNNLGLPNTAYPGVPGNFPTVWQGTPAGQPAGPRHANPTLEGILGQYISREVEADSGNDQDGVNNILNGGADNADNDRGDDGWRNRQATFDHCTQTTLTIRVSKAPGATLERMYLNVWFDGNRDGDWDDRMPCTPEGEALAIPATEWIVQDYVVDMTGIPAGGYVDINVNTQTILNTTPEDDHWMRFTLSEARAVQTANGRADGRGPHPSVGSYQFGETEDVRQRPPLPGEPGTLELDKRVILNSNPLDQMEAFSYQIRLRHNGGSQPIQAEIRDELPYTLYTDPSIYYSVITGAGIDVRANGNVTPLQATFEVKPLEYPTPERWIVKWQGTLAPESEIILTISTRMFVLCPPGQQTQQITNVAQARPRNGSPITASVTFTADCLGYDWEMIPVEWDAAVIQAGEVLNLNNHRLRATLRNEHDIPVTLRVTPQLDSNLPADAAIALPSFAQITLEPGESRPVEFKIGLNDAAQDELRLPADVTLTSTLNYCILPDQNATECLDARQYPQLHGQSEPTMIRVRPRDLGDAPDSTNHAGVPMTAYPGVQASFPTVFDPSTGLPQGPMHAYPRPFHLGPQVSLEAEADIGPDQDPTNNILPATNIPDQDRFDDGINPQQWSLTHCQTTTLPVRVFISPQAVNWFRQQEQQGYLNIWLDGNRDGDWDDGGTCPNGQDLVEHIVIDFPVDVVSLGAGLHTLSVPTGLVPWPTAQAQKPAWVRVTLSERESNKTLQSGSIKHGDGRGYDRPFQTGETEDYLAYPQGTVGGGPDMDVQLNGRIGQTSRLTFKIDYANVGAQPSTAARLIFQKPEQLRNVDVMLLQTPGIPTNRIVETGENVTIDLPQMPGGESGTIVIGWDLAALVTTMSGTTSEAYTARVRVTQDGDTNPSNNEATATIQAHSPTPIIGAVVANGAAWGQRETTCRSTVNLVGRAAPGVPYDLLLNGNSVTTVSANADGTFTYPLQNLSDGRHNVRLEADQSSRMLVLDVATSLPIDPLSLVFTDSQGRTLHPPTPGWSLNAGIVGISLRSGETYQVGIDRCGADPNVQISLTLGSEIITLHDDDNDGHYTGSFTYAPPVQAATLATAAELRFDVTAGGVVRSFTTPLTTLTPGIISNALTGAPIAAANVTALDGTTFTAWPAAALGQSNPHSTDADGAYSFIAPGDDNRLNVIREGYQPYQSGNIATTNGILNQNIALTPIIDGTTTHTVYVTANGFVPALLQVPPGSVIAWVNADLAEHSTTSSTWDSGALDAGQSYRMRLDSTGSYTYQDATNPRNTATIIVESNGGTTGRYVFLPLIVR